MKFYFLLSLTIFLNAGASQAMSESEALARKVYLRVAGKPLHHRNPVFEEMVSLVGSGKVFEAAQLATLEESFVVTTAQQWATVMLSPTQDAYLPMSDQVATAMGAARDNLDAKLLLTGDFIYGADPRMGLGRPKTNSNLMYERMAQSSKSFSKILKKYEPQWTLAKITNRSGILTTRGWAAVQYSAGTNRRAVKNSFQSFLCTDIELWKRPGLPTFRIRRDVDRAPGGNASEFQKKCRSCHAPMDALGGAFAHIDFKNNEFLFYPEVGPKFLQNEESYPDGFVTRDNSWVNLLATHNVSRFGFKGEPRGSGIKEFATMIADSDGFGRCMVKRAYDEVCDQEIGLYDSKIESMVSQYEAADLGLRDLFALVASKSHCLNI